MLAWVLVGISWGAIYAAIVLGSSDPTYGLWSLPGFVIGAGLLHVLLYRVAVILEPEALVIRGVTTRRIARRDIEQFREGKLSGTVGASAYALLRDDTIVSLPTITTGRLIPSRFFPESRSRFSQQMVQLHLWLAGSW